MAFESSSDLRQHIFSETKKKDGNIHIHLAVTPNGKARLSIGYNRKDFVNQRDALEWLIHSYNLKHLKNVLTSPPHAISDFDKLKTEKGFSPDEIAHVYGMVIESLKKLLDKTLHHARYQVYKKYLDQLNMRNSKREIHL